MSNKLACSIYNYFTPYLEILVTEVGFQFVRVYSFRGRLFSGLSPIFGDFLLLCWFESSSKLLWVSMFNKTCSLKQ